MSNMDARKSDNSGKKRKGSGRRRGRPHPIIRILNFIGGVIGLLFTMVLIGCITGLMLVGIFMTYVNTSLKPDLYVDASEYVLKQSSILYYMDSETGNWTELQKLHGTENRVLVEYEDIPQYLIDAAIAIEDKRFEQHRGVDWRRTGGAVLELAKGDKSYGGSTITQQLLKNMTGDRQTTIKRKVTEIFRALEFEQRYTKEEIMEMYLNTITLGQGCYGVQTAAQLYFGKDVSDLTLAECACIISITNNPSLYGPFSAVKVTNTETGVVKTAREMNKRRQETILYEMYDQGKITLTEYTQAVAEELQFADSSRTVEDIVEEENEKKNQGAGKQSWFVDEARREVVNDMMEQLGLTKQQAETKLLNGGYKIYLTIDPKIQELAESVYEERSNMDVVSASGQQLRSGITIVDNSTGNVVAMVGDIGAKQGDMIFNYAMATRQCGSSIKPLSLYSPALDAGVITMATVFDDYPVRTISGNPWPRNSPTTYKGRTLLERGVYESVNTYAVQTIEKLGLNNSYNFLTENLGLTTITEQDSIQIGNLGLGGLEKGVTTKEMAAAYATFGNDGVYNKPRMYVKVTDAEGKDILVNDQETSVAMKQTTAHFMNELLTAAVQKGTGKSARFDGMTIAGKTGTTNDNYDRYFVGYTPYYSAAVWTGFDQNEKISYPSGSPAIDLWRMVMEKVHAGLEDTGFHEPDGGMMTIKICRDSGMLASENCKHDLRGSRVTTVEVAIGTQPQETCTMHVMREYCTVGKCLKFPGCTEDCVTTVALLDYDRPEYYSNGVYDPETGTISAPTKKDATGEIVEMPLNIIPATDDAYVISRLDDTKECPVHGLGEGWAYDEEGNLVYTPPVVEPEIPEGWDPGTGEVPGGGTFEDWWESIFGGSDPQNPGTEQPGDGTVTDPTVPGDPTAPVDPTPTPPAEPLPTPPVEPLQPEDSGNAAGGTSALQGLLDLFTR